MISPETRSQSLAELSDAPVRMKEESAENAASQTQFPCPVSVDERERVIDLISDDESEFIDQFFTKPSEPIVISNLHRIKKNNTALSIT